MMTDEMHQVAPYPKVLGELVDKLTYRPGWKVSLVDMDRGQGSRGLTLDIITRGYNSYHPENGQYYQVHHYMIVPSASYDRESWANWLLEQFFLVERHEACEFFEIDGEKIFAPHHAPGADPYIVWHHGSDVDRRTSFKGVVKDEG